MKYGSTLDGAAKPPTKEIEIIVLEQPFPQKRKVTLHLCPKCDDYGFQSVYGNMCTACANAERHPIPSPAPAQPKPWWRFW